MSGEIEFMMTVKRAVACERPAKNALLGHDRVEAILDEVVKYQLESLPREEHRDAKELIRRRIWERIRRFTNVESAAAINAWLRTLASGVAIDYRKKYRKDREKRAKLVELTEGSNESRNYPESVSDYIDKRLLAIAFRQAMAKLDKDDHQLLYGKYVDGKSFRELEVETGIPKSTIELKIKMARNLIISYIKRQLGAE